MQLWEQGNERQEHQYECLFHAKEGKMEREKRQGEAAS
jgi:hypothetical protein